MKDEIGTGRRFDVSDIIGEKRDLHGRKFDRWHDFTPRDKPAGFNSYTAEQTKDGVFKATCKTVSKAFDHYTNKSMYETIKEQPLCK